MAGVAHQWLLLWACRKMTSDGYAVTHYDGPTPHGGVWNSLPRPYSVGGLRPDGLGSHAATGELALVEAKTALDIMTPHSLTQMRVFGGKFWNGELCRLYLAVPHTCVEILDRALVRTGLVSSVTIIRIHVPECLLKDPMEWRAND